MVYFDYYENSILFKDALRINLKLRYMNYFFILFFMFLFLIRYLKCPSTYYASYVFFFSMCIVYLLYLSENDKLNRKVNSILNPVKDDEVNQKIRPLYISFIEKLNNKYYITKKFLKLFWFFPLLFFIAYVYLFHSAFKMDYPTGVPFMSYLNIKLKVFLEKAFQSNYMAKSTEAGFLNRTKQGAMNRVKAYTVDFVFKNMLGVTMVNPLKKIDNELIKKIENNSCNL